MSEGASPASAAAGSSGRSDRLAAGTRVGRFLVEEPVGRGGMAVVYRVRDAENGVPAALKLLNQDALDRAGADELAREFRILVRLKHPNVVQALDYLDVGGRPALVMEFVEGSLLSDIIEAGLAEDMEQRCADCVVYLRQIADALTCLHAERVVHLDLKPQNLIRTLDGRLRLMDFGISRTGHAEPVLAANASEGTMILGTPAYMSPEQILAQDPDFKTDLYALGCIGHELLLGRVPVRPEGGEEAGYEAWKKAITKRKSERMGKLVPEAPPALADLLDRLLSLDKKHRPASAEAVLTELEALLEEVEEKRASQNEGVLPSAALNGPPTVGRGKLVVRVQDALDRAQRARRGSWHLVHGRPSEGLSTAAGHLVEILRIKGYRAFMGVCPRSPSADYVAFHRYILEGLAALPPEDDKLAMKAARQVLEAQIFAGGGKDDAQSVRRSMLRAIEQLTRTLAVDAEGERQPVLIVLDDLHLADVGTMALWWDLARRVSREVPVVVVATVDGGRRGTSMLLKRLGLGDVPDGTILSLPPLTDDDVAKMAEGMLGQAAPPMLSRELREASGGLPGLTAAALRSLVDGGAVSQRHGRWQTDDDVAKFRPDRMHVSEELRRMVVRILRPLGEGERNLLSWLAIGGEEMPGRLLKDMVDLDERTLRDAAQRLLDRGVIERRGDGFKVSSGLVTRATLSAMSKGLRKSLHLEVARRGDALLQKLGYKSVEERSEWLGRQYLGAGLQSNAVVYLIMAARRLQAMDLPNRAEKLLRAADGLLGSSEGRGSGDEKLMTELVAVRVDLRRRLGDAPGASRDATQLLARARFRKDTEMHAKALRAVVDAERMSGRMAAAREASGQAVEIARQAGGDSLVQALAMAGRVETLAGDLEAAQGFLAEGLAVARVGGYTKGFVEAAEAAAELHVARGEIPAAEWQLASIEQAAEQGAEEPVPVQLRRLRLLSELRLRKGDLAGARIAASRARARSRERGAVEWESWAGLADADVSLALGDTSAAASRIDDAVSAAEDGGLKALVAAARLAAVRLSLERSDAEGAERDAREAASTAGSTDVQPLIQQAQALSGWVAIERNDVPTAYEVAQLLQKTASGAWIRLDSLLLLAAAHRGRGVPAAAVEPAREALHIADKLKTWELRLQALYQLGLSLILVEEDEEGIMALKVAVAQIEKACKGWSAVDAERLKSRPLIRRIYRTAGAHIDG